MKMLSVVNVIEYIFLQHEMKYVVVCIVDCSCFIINKSKITENCVSCDKIRNQLCDICNL